MNALIYLDPTKNNYKVVDVSENVFEASSEFGWIDCPDNVNVGWVWQGDIDLINNRIDNLKFVDPDTLRNLDDEKKYILAKIRHKRNQFLFESDWTQSRDVFLPNDEEWKTYRQELRDITENLVIEIDMDINWPTKPS